MSDSKQSTLRYFTKETTIKTTQYRNVKEKLVMEKSIEVRLKEEKVQEEATDMDFARNLQKRKGQYRRHALITVAFFALSTSDLLNVFQ